MKTFWKIIDITFDLLLALGVFLIVALCMTEIISRNIFGQSVFWSNEAARYSFVYVVFIGSGILARDRDFICMDIIKNRVPTSIKYYYDTVLNLFLVYFAFIMIKSGYALALANNMQKSSALGMSKYVLYMIMPISGVIMGIYTIRNIYEDTRNKFGKGEAK